MTINEKAPTACGFYAQNPFVENGSSTIAVGQALVYIYSVNPSLKTHIHAYGQNATKNRLTDPVAIASV